MLEALNAHFAQRTGLEVARDALDILIVYYVTYRVLLLFKGTRAQHIAVGLLAVFGCTRWLSSSSSAWCSASWLAHLEPHPGGGGRVPERHPPRSAARRQRAWLPGQARAKASQVLAEVVEAATDLARHRTGALIAIEQDANLDEFVGVNKGKEIDAIVTSELLVSLFVPDGMNKLHDGAVIIRNHRIAKAGVFFPMPEGRVLAQHLGSRHRAALGITEETDAVVVVVSEERGTISYCFNGNHVGDLNGPALRSALESIYHPQQRRKPKAPAVAPLRVPVAVPPRPAEEERPEELSITLPLRFEAEPATGRGSRCRRSG
jgi:DNA integrity scanning protein DisA with diadenylate cyclase activity